MWNQRTLPYNLFNMPPRKEGRHYSLRRRRPTATFRFLLIALAIAVIYTVIISLIVPSHQAQKLQMKHPALEKTTRAVSEADSVIEKTEPSILVKKPVIRTPLKAPDEQGPQSVLEVAPTPVAQRGALEVQSATKDQNTEDEDHSRFQAALSSVFSLLPDEIHIRELLRPVEGTGKEKLREIGLRTRAYKVFFEAWETLHLVPKGDNFYIRDNVVQYLRSHSDSASTSPISFAQTVRSYEAYRHFLQRISELLFPWTAPYFSDHMTLHNHFRKGGRGIVLSAGDDQAPFLLTSIPSFRKLGCTLPIEAMYLGDSDLSEDYRIELELLPGVITRDLSQMVSDEGWKLAGWAAKPFAILLSSFREVIFIDADALFFHNPEVLFEDALYVETGAFVL
jgi:alpha 1,3-mannosyltransferase